MTRTLVLGAGFGGIAVATTLRRLLGGTHEVLLVDRREHFMMGLRKPWAVVGLGTLEEGRRSRTALTGGGVLFVQAEILEIDPVRRRVRTDDGTLECDHLVVALGAEPRPDLVPGLSSHAHDLYDAAAIPALADTVARLEGGRILILIAGVPYRCPPAPFECAMLLDAHLRERGLRDACAITVSTLQPMLMPNAGRAGSAWLGEQLRSRGVEWHAGRKVAAVESGRVLFEGSEALECDVLIGVPPHRPPRIVKESGLTGDGEWIAIDAGTLQTMHPGVFAIGDVTHVPLANGLPLPKAGVFAELEGERVGAAIAAALSGSAPPPPFSGQGYCFIETGSQSATLVQGDFFAQPEPRVWLGDVSAENAAAKRAFESDRLRRWFGA